MKNIARPTTISHGFAPDPFWKNRKQLMTDLAVAVDQALHDLDVTIAVEL
jgi:hypothetical protein